MSVRFVLAVILSIASLHYSRCVRAEDAVLAPQYRFRNVSIPGATADEPKRERFSSTAAKSHLEAGVTLWASQKKCVSCHTHGMFMLTRPALSKYWGKPPTAVRDFVVQQARDILQDNDSTGSTPAQIAYIARGLAEWDAHVNKTMSPETDSTLRYVIGLQDDDGSIKASYRWPPINSDTYHATIMAAMATATAPGWRENMDNEEISSRVERLDDYLKNTTPKHDHQRLLLLWASTRVPNLLTEQQQQRIIDMIWKHQRDDGGWSIRTFASPDEFGGGKKAELLKTDPHYLNPVSDAYQTGLAIVVLRDAGIPAHDERIVRGVKWLLSNQRESGRWWTRSLNTTSRFHYITYSGSAYASLALAQCNRLPVLSPTTSR